MSSTKSNFPIPRALRSPFHYDRIPGQNRHHWIDLARIHLAPFLGIRAPRNSLQQENVLQMVEQLVQILTSGRNALRLQIRLEIRDTEVTSRISRPTTPDHHHRLARKTPAPTLPDASTLATQSPHQSESSLAAYVFRVKTTFFSTDSRAT